ncbi:MAG: pilus assembly protein N-terminal domain-containing protein [Pseudomonadota bacterium]
MRAVVSILISMIALFSSAQAGQIWLTMDYVRPHKLERPATNILIGNPAIADVTVQDDQNILLYGKAPGMTNILIVDADGQMIESMIVRVRTNSTDMLTYHRGIARTTYNCTTNCEATVTVGDDQEVFGAVAAQVSQKFGQAAQNAGQ